MPLSTKTLTATIYGPDGQPIPQAMMEFQLVNSDTALSGHVAKTIYRQFSDTSGEVTVSLVPSVYLDDNSWYLCRASVPGVGLQREVSLYTVGFTMPNYDALLENIATSPNVLVNADTLAAVGYAESEFAEGWSQGITTNGSTITKDTLTNSYGEAGIVSDIAVLNYGYSSFEFVAPALIDAYVGTTVQDADVLDSPSIRVVKVGLALTGDLTVEINDLELSVYAGAYVAGDTIRVITQSDSIVKVYKNDILIATSGSPVNAAFPWYFCAAIKTDAGVIENFIVGGDNVGEPRGD